MPEPRPSQRCIGCKMHPPGQELCSKYNDIPRFCAAKCIDDRPDCPRDHPIIRRKIQIRRIIRASAACAHCCLASCEGCSTAAKLDSMIFPLSHLGDPEDRV